MATIEEKRTAINQIYDVVRTQFVGLSDHQIVNLMVGAGVEPDLAQEVVKRAKSGEVL
jgi:hypothetical protein